MWFLLDTRTGSVRFTHFFPTRETMVKGTFPFPMFSQCAHSAFLTRETLVKLQVFKLDHCEILSFFSALILCKRYFSGDLTFREVRFVMLLAISQ